MNRLILFLAIILLLMSCKSKHDITGLYNLEKSNVNIIKLNADSTFQFEYFNLLKFDFDTYQSKKVNDPHRFATSGKWHRIAGDSIILNSLTNTTDTSCYWDIITEPNKTGNFKFTFKSLSGNNVNIFQISKNPDFKNYIAMRLHRGFEYFEIKPEKFDTLYFEIVSGNMLYPTWCFIKGNNTPGDYIVTLKPSHVQGYFKNRTLTIKNNRLILSKDSVYKKLTPSQ